MSSSTITTATPSQGEESSNVTNAEESPNQTNLEENSELSLVRFETIQPITLTSKTSTIISNTTDSREERLNQQMCRICWVDGILSELVNLTCKCRGTMGLVHVECLKEWERVRRTRRCEICKEVYMQKRDFMTILWSFFQHKYAGVLCCKICNIAAVSVLTYANVVFGEANINRVILMNEALPNRNNATYTITMLTEAILPFLIINYIAANFAISEIYDCYRLFRDWWFHEN